MMSGTIKINEFIVIWQEFDTYLKNKTSKETRLKFYKTVAVSTLIYESES